MLRTVGDRVAHCSGYARNPVSQCLSSQLHEGNEGVAGVAAHVQMRKHRKQGDSLKASQCRVLWMPTPLI